MQGLSQTIRWIFDTQGALSSMQNITRKTQSMHKQFGGLATTIAGAFGTYQIANYAKEAVTLAGKMEGVSQAFNKLGYAGMLDDLNTATLGTVSNLELMQKSVMAINLGIDKNQLPAYFEFATKRAQETGESVDYLVDSIVRGVGRQSALILDNLGISALALAKELEKGGTYAEAVGRIIQTEMAASGKAIETAATKQAQLNKTLEDTKTELGANLAPAFQGILEIINNMAKGMNHLLKTDLQQTLEGNRKMFEYIVKDSKDWAEVINRTNKAIERSYTKIADLQKQRAGAGSANSKTKVSEEIGLEFQAITELKNLLTNYQVEQNKVNKATGEAVYTVGFYKDQIAALTQEIEKQTERGKILEITAQIDKYTAALERLTSVSRKAVVVPTALQSKTPNLGSAATPNLENHIAPLVPYVDTSAVDAYYARAKEVADITESMNQSISNSINAAAASFAAGIGTMIGAAMAGKASFADFGNFALSALGEMLTQLGQIAIETGIGLLAIQTALKSMNPALAIAAGVALMAIGGVVASRVSSLGGGNGGQQTGGQGGWRSDQIPGFANGGIVTAPTFAMVGEGSESEAILPLSKLQNLINMGGGSGNVKLRGYDLMIAYDRQKKRNNRIK